jgi:hypothetical protein
MQQLLEAPIISAEEEVENMPEVGTLLTNTQADYLVSDGKVLVSPQPLVEDGRAVRFNPQAMTEGTPYPFMMSNCWFVAMKRPEGHIDFFVVQ